MNGFFFGLDRPRPENPALSVICINKNHGKYIEDTILSVLSQKFDDFEFIISDGGSSDCSLEIIDKYKFITLLSGGDSSREEGLTQALAAARGRYVMITTSTDGYLSRDWFKSAVLTLEADAQASMVFGSSAAMSAEGSLGGITFPNQFSFGDLLPKEKYAEMWLHNGIRGAYLPELNYCVRMDVYRAVFGPSHDFPELNSIDPILRAHFEFNRLGYLARYLPILANFGRTHANQEQFSERNRAYSRVYDDVWNKYRSDIISGRKQHVLRGGTGQVLAKVVVQQA